ncbi:unnamed protein product [Fusarium graminearum]|uniref:Uncharacterized protein n=1 Tax=Gibberella zeae TaxID=5518 RepID=A0A9N8WTL6_GIBZA|nr:unnamed protein product [Fusarium graminearum]
MVLQKEKTEHKQQRIKFETFSCDAKDVPSSEHKPQRSHYNSARPVDVILIDTLALRLRPTHSTRPESRKAPPITPCTSPL